MIAILKTLVLPIMFVLPWAAVNLNDNLKTFIEERIIDQPILMLLILFPSILLTFLWLAHSYRNKHS